MVFSVAFQIPLAQELVAFHGLASSESSSARKYSKKSFANLRWQYGTCSNEMLLLVSDCPRHSECKNHSSLIGLRRKRNMSLPDSTEPFILVA